ncbi:MAG: hypothetical protein JSU63_13880, partial [Phycisphaerales bacterium]
MADHFGDRVVTAIKTRNAPVCVGFDPLIERLPPDLLKAHGVSLTDAGAIGGDVPPSAITEAMYIFGREVIDIVAAHVPIVKINIAFFERYYAD